MTTRLSTDAVTAYRLALDDAGVATTSDVMSAWNALDPSRRHSPEDLHASLRREGDRIVADEEYSPMRLTIDEILGEMVRLAGISHAPDADGWHDASRLMRIGYGLGARRALDAIGIHQRLATYVRSNRIMEVRTHAGLTLMRPSARARDEATSNQVVTCEATCPGDAVPRALPTSPSFGHAYRAVARLQRELVADGTLIAMRRGDEARIVVFDAASTRWITKDGSPMRRLDPSDPVLHGYANGRLVDAMIGFVSVSARGRFFATVGTPIDLPGDDDAHIVELDRKEAADHAEALALLRGRTDLDHVFTGTHRHDGIMGFWLSGMRDAPTPAPRHDPAPHANGGTATIAQRLMAFVVLMGMPPRGGTLASLMSAAGVPADAAAAFADDLEDVARDCMDLAVSMEQPLDHVEAETFLELMRAMAA